MMDSNEVPTKTKIIATIGPRTESEEMISKLIDVGVDVFRLNFSHGSHEWHEMIFKRIRKLCTYVPIMFDVSGPNNAEKRVENAIDVGAELLLTACPFCVVTLDAAVKTLDKDDEIKVMDIAELLLESIKEI